MQKLLSFLIIGLFVFSCQSNNQESEEIDEPTRKRDKAAEMIKNSAGAIEANWESPKVLVLTFTRDKISKYLSTNRKNDGKDKTLEQTTKEMAIAYAVFVAPDVGTEVCIKIQYPDGEQLAYECVE